MTDYLRKRYLRDVEIHRSTNKSLLRSSSAVSLIESPALTDLKQPKELYKITSDVLAFRRNAILACKHMQTFLEEIAPFCNTPKEAAQYMHSLDISLPLELNQYVSFMEHEFKVLKKNYAHLKSILDEEDELVPQEENETQQSSGDEVDISPSCLQEMIAHLDNRVVNVDECSPQPLPISARLSLIKRERSNESIIDLQQCATLLNNVGKMGSPPPVTTTISHDEHEMFHFDDKYSLITVQGNNNETTLISFDVEALDEVPDDNSLLSSVNISLNLSSNGSLIIPKPSVLRISYADSQENKHIMSKHYVHTDECYVRIPMREKLLVDTFQRKAKRKPSTSSSITSTSSSDVSRGSSKSPKSKRRRNTSSSLPSPSSSDDSSYSPPSCSSSDGSGKSGSGDYLMRYFPDSSDSDSSSASSGKDRVSQRLDEIPDGYSDSSSSSESPHSSEDRMEDGSIKNDDKPKPDIKNTTPTKPKPAWMNDPLLKPLKWNLVDSSSEEASIKEESTDDEKPEIDDDTTDDEVEKPIRSKLSLKKKRYIIDSDEDDLWMIDFRPKTPPKESGGEDSEVEFVSSVSKGDGASPAKGRRNIKGILSEGDLNAATQMVQEEERERIERLQLRNSQLSTSSLESDLVLDGNAEHPIDVHSRLAQKLLAHQRKGVQFLWDNCYESVERIQRGDKGAGCILAHCMGLGKTFQVVTLVHTLFRHPVTKTKRVLVICPISTMNIWCKEFKDAIKLAGARQPDFKVYHAGTSTDKWSKRIGTLRNWYRDGGVMIVGYSSFLALLNKTQAAIDEYFLSPGPDLVVCDEGHMLKSGKSNRTKLISKIRTRRRIILTGTPMQNNLDEYYCMVGFVKPNFLGTEKEYRNRFVNPINNGQFENSTTFDIQRMKKRSHVLHKMTRHFIQRFEERELAQHLPDKYDYSLKIDMSDVQIRLIKTFLNICNYRQIFANLVVMRAICAHPYLLQMQEKNRNKEKKSKKGNEPEELSAVLDGIDLDWWKAEVPADAATNIGYGPKLKVMMSIIKATMARNEKLLIFSVSLLELDLIEKFLRQTDTSWVRGRSYHRMDGNVDVATRTNFCNSFNTPASSIKLMLLTPKVGGLGLNLFAANRAIIMDTSWNPADDTQSVFRIYRLGQAKTCYIYRLIAKGTMEEVVYERSVTKQAISGRVVDEMQITRHFQSSDLEAMYRCKLDNTGERPMPKLPQDSLLANLLQEHHCIYTYQDHKELLQNRPDEELDEAEMKLAWEEYEKEKNVVVQYPPLPPEVTEPAPGTSFTSAFAELVQSSAVAANAALRSMFEHAGATPATPQQSVSMDRLKGKTILFESPLTKGGKVLASYNEQGKIVNEARADQLTRKQIDTAERLPIFMPREVTSKLFMISRTGALVDMERASHLTTPHRPSILRKELATPLPKGNTKASEHQPRNGVGATPIISASINLVDNDDLDLQIIE